MAYFLDYSCISKPNFASFGHPTIVNLCQRYVKIIEQMVIGYIENAIPEDSR